MARMAMVVLLGLCMLPLASAQDQPTAVDVVFVVDSSNSMSKNDPEGLRNHFMAMTADFMQGRGGDRLAIVQFAGWNETQNKKVIVFPLTEIPQPGKGADFEKAFDAAVAKSEIFGSASDINVAFELGVAEVQKQRGATKNGLWVIVLTDAALSAPEPGNVREDYKKKAAELFKLAPDDEANLDQLNAAALDIFTKQTLPKYAGTRISAVTLAKKAPPADSPIQMLVGKESKVGVLSKDPLKDLIVPMLAGSQLYPKAKGGFYGYAKEAGTKASVPVHVYEGAVGTRALLFSRGGTLKVTVTGGDASKVESLGDGPYKVVHFRNAPPGDYTIDAEAEGGSQIESVVYSDLPYSADIKLSTPADVAAGDEVKIDLAVTRDGKPLTDPALLKSLKAVVKIKDAKGTTTKEVEFKADSKGQFSFATDPAAPPGDIEFTVELAAVQDGTVAPYAFTPGAKTFKVSVATVVEASFDKAEVFVDEPVGFTVKGAKGTPAKDLLSELGLKKGTGEHKAKLSWKDGAWSGTVPTDAIGEFQIAEEKKGGVIVKAGKNPKLTIKGRVFEASFSASEVYERQAVTLTVKPADGGKAESAKDLVKEIKAGDAAIKVAYKADGWTGDVDTQKAATFELKETTAQKYVIKPGKNGKLVVKPRSFEILDKDGKPVEKLVFPVKYIEKGQYSIDVTLKLSVGEGETGQIEALGEPKDKDVVIGLAGQKTVTGAAATQTAKVVLDINTDAAIQEQQGRIVVRATIAGLSDLKWEKAIPVEVQFTDKAKKLFMKYLPFIIGGLVLLLIILYVLLLARWKEQQLRAFLNNNLDTKYMLKSMGGGRSATGTEQSPASAGFSLSGMKFTENAVSLKALKPDVHVFHMDKPLTAPAKLRHGDVLAVEVGSKKQYYVYFEKEPTPEELKKALDGLIESDEIFIEE